jgi:N6-L-threonylcarbamoyladenine synthase
LAVNHLEGHLLAPFLRDSRNSHRPLILIIPISASPLAVGTPASIEIQGLGEYQILGATKDDAAGEAFDKFAKMAGLGFPGGVKG